MKLRLRFALGALTTLACGTSASSEGSTSGEDDGSTAGSGADASSGSDDTGASDPDTGDTDDTGDTNDTGDTDDTDDTGPSCEATHTAAESWQWSLPEPSAVLQYEPFVQTSGANYCTGEDFTDFLHTTIDLTGDGIVDLVVTSACDDGDVGTDFWLVYAGGADGFASAPSQWTLPEPSAAVQYEPFVQVGGANYCTGDDYTDFLYTTIDLTADGILDLVVTSACDEGGVGTDFWLVYAGGASGFASEPSQWALPEPIAGVQYEPFVQIGGANYCVGEDYTDFLYTTLDLTGDGILDLVVTSACDDGGVGTDSWLVYAGGADGFASEPSPWALPIPSAGLQYEPFVQTGGANYCTGEDYTDFLYSTIDLTGDDILDLVVTSACDDGDVGTDSWLVYAGGADGFADEPSMWALPTPTANLQYEPFVQLGGASYCTGDDYTDFLYTTIDLTADGILDLVVTSACDDGGVGTDSWLVYPGGADGFASEPSQWTLPAPSAALQYEPFVQIGGANYCTGEDYTDFLYTTMDLDGDEILDLVVTSACDDGGAGTDFWLVYPGACD